ncbi:MAG: transcription-repair coupling factor [Eggerthellaceae bacterium]|nr:transcription-repair coupling factor [Eggerthellaceae bacterium]
MKLIVYWGIVTMLIDLLSATLQKSKALDAAWKKMDNKEDAVIGVASSARPFLVAARFVADPRTTLVITAGEDAADTFARTVGAFVGEERVLRYADYEGNPFSVDAPMRPQLHGMRLKALWALQSKKPVIVVASARALLRKVALPQTEIAKPLVLKQGVDLSESPQGNVESFEDLAEELVCMGYDNAGELAGPGTFCLQGGAIDIFPGNLAYPVRCDFFGDELDEIRRFLPSTGQTISSLSEVEIYPVREFKNDQKSLRSAQRLLAKQADTNKELRSLLERLQDDSKEIPDVLASYMLGETTTVGAYLPSSALTVIIEPRSLFDDAQHALDEYGKLAQGTSIPVSDLYVSAAELNFGSNPRATYVSIMCVGVELDSELVVKRIEVAGDPEKLYGRLRSLAEAGFTVVFSVPHFRARQEIKLSLVDLGIPINEVLDVVGDDSAKLRRGQVNIVDVDIPLGMIFPAAKMALVSLADTQGSMATRKRSRIDVTEITFPYKPGDYVVHAAHGVAFFRDIVRQDVGGSERDYLLLEYAQGDKLYVPVEQLDRVTRYVGPEGSSPRLTRLNTSDWSRALTKARKATKKLAFDLVDVYTRRAATQGYRYGEDTLAQREMEESFPYQETPDQLAAIADIKADMQSPHPMDRLVCGDVGFGKTEVALRAAFKATQDNKQVMVLCPTTILAQQHYSTFSERFAPFNVRVEVLSRFRTPAQQKQALEDFANGKVAVLVGTHRLLSRDVNPHDLGLVIIDEEQRFGVGHKEQLKNMRESIDVLTLSATPIPRTMQMGLSGVRDMSLILTPPDDRRPVKVHVGEWDPDLVSDAIRRELARKGQVYYVSNRVRSIEEAVQRVHAAAGEARVGVAHGQMTKEQLEHVMEDFAAGELDVLVATTIIESGIDNPHTNTLIIEDSQRLGLAQMYQLKGRVGRSSTQAYAYFLFPDNITMTEEAMARLTALNEHTELGSGMRVAMRDLEIRGAGSLLGAEQSGNMSAVGFDLFAQMLATAVNMTREGNTSSSEYLPPALSDIVVNVPDHTYFPEEYLPDADERVLYYRKIASADTLDAVEDIYQELISKHPEMPQAAINQIEKARLKAFANEHGIHLISVTGGKLVIEPITLTKTQASALRRKAGRYFADKKKMTVPLRVFVPKQTEENPDDAGMLSHVFNYIRSLFEEK